MADASYPIGAGRDPRVPLQVEQAPRNLNYSEIDWDGVMSILRQAERGATERLADLTRRMLTDGHLAAACENRKLAVAVAKLAAEPASDDEIDVRGAEDVQRMLDALPIARIKKDCADGITTGWACLQIFWAAKSNGWLWPERVEWNHPRRFRFDWRFRPYIYDDGRAVADQLRLSREEQFECSKVGIVGMPLDAYRWIVHMPRAFPDYPQMGGVLLSAIRAWWIKSQAIRYQLAGAELAGNGRVIGKQDPNADANTKSAFLTNLENWGASGVMVVSPGADVSFVAPLAQGASSVWSTLIEEMNREESKAILGSTLAVDTGPNGSRSLGESQKSITIDTRAEADDDEIRHTLERDLVGSFLELNRWAYGGRKPSVKLRSIWIEEDVPQVDELLIKTGSVTRNQLLVSRGLPPWPEDEGGDDIVTLPDALPPLPALPVSEPVSGGPVAADGTPVEAVADTALNGAQVESLLSIMEQVSAGALAAEAAVLTILSSFPSIPEARARAMVGAQSVQSAPAETAAAAVAPVAITAGDVWTDSTDQHRLKVNATDGERVYLVDLDGANPGEQFAWAVPSFRARCLPPATPTASGGTPAASPLPDGAADERPLGLDEAHGDLWALSEGDRQAALTGVGQPGILTAQAMLDGVPLFERLRADLLAVVAGSTDKTLGQRLGAFTRRKSADLADHLYEVGLQGRMAGALFVAQYEVPEAFEATRALDARPVPPFLALPFDEAVEAFERRRIVTPEEWATMDEEARAGAFTATRLAHETLVRRARELLLRTLREGGTFEEFRDALNEDEHVLGVTPSAPWYLETVYRSNVQAAYGAGRYQLITSPAVRAARPYVERRTARDNRVRESHAALEGAVFAQDDPGLAGYAPPYLGGEFAYNCRCVLVARRADDVDLSRLVSTSSL